MSTIPLRLSISSFNLLAPCYNRNVGTSFRPQPRKRGLESCDSATWQPRNEEIIHLLQLMDTDILCLQEYWFEPEFTSFFESRMPAYTFVKFQRTGFKQDGVAILVKKDKFHVVDIRELALHGAGNRVALLCRVRFKNVPDGVDPRSTELVLGNTHLTFPHNNFDRRLRDWQARLFTEFVDAYVQQKKLHGIGSVLCGDFNGNENDPVCQHMSVHGYTSSFTEANSRPCGITHRNHNGHDDGVDFVFYKHSTQHREATAPRASTLTGSMTRGISVVKPQSHAYSPLDRTVSTPMGRLKQLTEALKSLNGPDSGPPSAEPVHIEQSLEQPAEDEDGEEEGDTPPISDDEEEIPTPKSEPPSALRPELYWRLKVAESFLEPRGVTDESWPETFQISDHRPLVTSFVFRHS